MERQLLIGARERSGLSVLDGAAAGQRCEGGHMVPGVRLAETNWLEEASMGAVFVSCCCHK